MCATVNGGPCYGIKLSAERPTLDGRLLDELIEQYLLDVDRRSNYKTARGYRYKLRHFRDRWALIGPGVDWRLTHRELEDFARHLESLISARGILLAFNTRKDIMRRLRQVFRWAHKRGHIPVDLSDAVPMPHGAAPAKHPVDLAALNAMLNAAGRSSFPLRDRALIALLAGTAIRCEECSALRVEQVTIYSDRSGVASIDEAKNDKPRYVAFDSATGKIIDAYLIALEQRDSPGGPLFRSRNGHRQPLTPSGIYKTISRLAVAAGVNDQVRGAHDLRRMFATMWARRLRGEGYGHLLQKQLGHKSFETTQAHYILQDIGDVLEALQSEAVSPIAQLEAQGL